MPVARKSTTNSKKSHFTETIKDTAHKATHSVSRKSISRFGIKRACLLALVASFILQLTPVEVAIVLGQWVGNLAIVVLIGAIIVGSVKRWPNPFSFVAWAIALAMIFVGFGIYLFGAGLYADLAITITRDASPSNFLVAFFRAGAERNWGLAGFLFGTVNAMLLSLTNALRISTAVIFTQILYLVITLLEIGPTIIRNSPYLSAKKAIWLGSKQKLTVRSEAGPYEREAAEDFNDYGENLFRSLSNVQVGAYFVDICVVLFALWSRLFTHNPNALTFIPSEHIDYAVGLQALVLIGGMQLFTYCTMLVVRAYEITLVESHKAN